ncbi:MULTISPECIES: family 1 glycosylhydrolase [unclassified Brevundimonas]|uniref:family 1 glycosylhydrolase n=1 Tax=unclassified Brevundimonas TaxID=2622653 RepID=UPI000CFA8FB1|nr:MULTISPECIES: family 1 glycosylhydrolase [unclassified Brevundimonas]PRA27384.1 beta-glucosidase [Brevundimonas sp. MYb27]PQZ84536.1 beta-glucosidase [Brevundimonas sp. MYb31]PRB17771.1 beta-glucosidase [Brevundimonas sp. MYb52]PRB38142.1 beta-glucosidase [Brevundimonas sp. MYb46]PRB56076.1 beta-glucosidase [Brevundimonas sp. MYb33]
MIDRRSLLAAGALIPTLGGAGAAFSAGRQSGAFPDRFLWGAATAAYQVEGNNVNSDTWVSENVKPSIYRERSGDANNSFELWAEDLDIVKAMGLNTYRFSLEWGRIEPDPGQFSVAMLDHYKRIVEGCRERGLTPMVTFNHFTTPRWFAGMGAWTNPDSVGRFATFCDRAARHLAADIGYATTLNEPNLIRVLQNAVPAAQLEQVTGYIKLMNAAAARAIGSDQFVAGNTIAVDDVEAMTTNMIAAHQQGRAAIKAVRSDLPVGLSLAIVDDQPAGPGSIYMAKREEQSGRWLEAVKGDDFLGVQNYEQARWDASGKVELQGEGDRNASNLLIVPESVANVVRYAHEKTGLPIMVTEHGFNTHEDAVRARNIPLALAELRKTLDEGVPLIGYVHWTLLDNFEWIYGYTHQYGLVAVDRETFVRTPKPSASVFGAIARRNAV